MTEIDNWRGQQFAILCESEPRLAEFEEEIFQFALCHDSNDCLAAWEGWGKWKWGGFQSVLSTMVGWDARVDEVATSAAWDIARDHLKNIMERTSSPAALTSGGWCP